MAKYKFTADRGVTFSEDGANPWAAFVLSEVDAKLEDGVAVRTYAFETDSADVASRLRKCDDYGIVEVKATKSPKAGD